MKFGGFRRGKPKEKENSQEDVSAETGEDLTNNSVEDDIPARPHAPLGELPLESEEKLDGPDFIPADEPEEPALDDAEGAKMVEVQAKPGAVSQEAPKEANNAELNTSISNIFKNVEDEENPLVNLIKALPDVAAVELLDDLKEINEIIKDWQKK